MFTGGPAGLHVPASRRRGLLTGEAFGVASRHRLASNIVRSITCVVKVGRPQAGHVTYSYHKPSVAAGVYPAFTHCRYWRFMPASGRLWCTLVGGSSAIGRS